MALSRRVGLLTLCVFYAHLTHYWTQTFTICPPDRSSTYSSPLRFFTSLLRTCGHQTGSRITLVKRIDGLTVAFTAQSPLRSQKTVRYVMIVCIGWEPVAKA
jgi:hypothetical protein